MRSCKAKARSVLRRTEFPLKFIGILSEKGLLRSGLKFLSCDIMHHCKTSRVAGNLLMRLFVLEFLCCFNHKYFYKMPWLAVGSILGGGGGAVLRGLGSGKPKSAAVGGAGHRKRGHLGSQRPGLGVLGLFGSICMHILERKSILFLALLSRLLTFLSVPVQIIKLKYREANGFRNLLRAQRRALVSAAKIQKKTLEAGSPSGRSGGGWHRLRCAFV